MGEQRTECFVALRPQRAKLPLFLKNVREG